MMQTVSQEKLAKIAFTTSITIRSIGKQLLDMLFGQHRFTYQIAYYKMPENGEAPEFKGVKTVENTTLDKLIMVMRKLNEINGGWEE